MFSWQLLLIALVPVSVATRGASRHRAREMDAAIAVSLAGIAITFLWGWLRGGAPYQAYYQLWRFLTGLLVGFLLISVMRTPRDLRALAMTIIVAALIRGTLVMYFYWVYVHGKMYPAPPYMTNHDDSLLFVTAIVAVGCWALIKGGRAAWFVAAAVTLYLFYAMVLNDRRIAWLELLLAMVAIYSLIGKGALRRRINRWAIIAMPFALAYVAVGWGREEALFAPIAALSSAGSDYDPSSLARQEEARNVLYTMSITGNPLLGTGWGVPYQKLTTVYNRYAADWVLAFYTPHNSLLGLALFAGLVGILGIWCVVPVAAYLAARCYKSSADPVIRAAAMAVVGILTAYSVHCFGDIGLQSFPCCVMLGVALGTSAKVAAWSRAALAAKTASAPAAQARQTRGPLPAVSRALTGRVRGEPAHRQLMSTTHGAPPRAGESTRRRRP